MTAPSRAAAPRRRRRALGAIGLIAALATAVALSLALGANPLPLDAVLAALGGAGEPEAGFVVRELRVPRTVAGVLAGAAIAVAGALIQAFTRNPLADPGLLGVNAGAAFAVAACVGLLGMREASALVWFAMAGALVVTLAVYAIGTSGRATGPLRLTLAGVAIGAVFSGVTTGMVLSDPLSFDAMRGWNAGSLLGRGVEVQLSVAPFIIGGLLLAAALTPALNALALGDDVARSQGADVRGIRAGVVAAVTLLAGAATALAGPIAFVGLMVPHAVRAVFGIDQRHVVLISAVAGPVVVLLADVLGRVLIAPAEIPVGVMTAFVGAPVLIALARRREVTAL